MTTTIDYNKFHSLIDDMKVKDVENEKLKKELEELKEKYSAMRSKIKRLCDNGYYKENKFWQKLEKEAPNFWKVLSNIDTPENMERYLFQLGCFMNNRRTKNHLVICGPSPSGKDVLLNLARNIGENIYIETDYTLCNRSNSIQLIDNKIKFYPFILGCDFDTCEKINKCLRFAKYNNKFIKYFNTLYGPIHTYYSWKSPMITATYLDPSGITEDCDIIHMKNKIESEAMDHSLGDKIKSEMDTIKSVCSDIFKMRKNELIDFN